MSRINSPHQKQSRGAEEREEAKTDEINRIKMKIYQQLRGIAAERGCEEDWSTGGRFQKNKQQNFNLQKAAKKEI